MDVRFLHDDFELLDGCGSDEDCSEGPSYHGNDELQLEELDALAREVTSADIASSDGGSSDGGSSDGGSSDDMPDSN